MYSNIVKSRFFKALEQIQYGHISLTGPDGSSYSFSGPEPGPRVRVQLEDWRVLSNMAAKGDVAMTEDYRDQRLHTDNLAGLLELGLVNQDYLQPYIRGSFFARMALQLSYLMNSNTLRGSRKNIQAHYDLGNNFYDLWLDKSMTYSAGIFHGTDDLSVAQELKYDRIIDRMESDSGRILELGCGWGGFADRALERGDFEIKGITLSEEQAAYAKQRLGSAADIAIEDYRIQEGKYDNLVSIEMFEAVGERYWPIYFGKIRELLARGGKAMVQTIVIGDQWFDRYRRGSDMIRTFVFPGGMLPSVARFKHEAERAGLKVRDTFFFGDDYARTLEHWEKNFDAAIPQINALGFDDEFVRVWKFYLAACIAGFRQDRTNVMQVELCHA